MHVTGEVRQAKYRVEVDGIQVNDFAAAQQVAVRAVDEQLFGARHHPAPTCSLDRSAP